MPTKSRKDSVSKMKKYYRMPCRAMIICSCMALLGGCASNSDQLPEIIHSTITNPRVVSRKVVKPKPSPSPRPKYDAIAHDFPRDWLPPTQVEKKWTAIVVHHSATENGNSAIFDKMHREQNHWVGVGYDFVIGNGTDSGDGEVEVTFRWQRQMAGAHCGGTPGNWANEDAVGICLVGNFNYRAPTASQMKSLSKLIRFLQKRYGISMSRIYSHGSTPGARVTDCPGHKFPMTRLKRMIGS